MNIEYKSKDLWNYISPTVPKANKLELRFSSFPSPPFPWRVVCQVRSRRYYIISKLQEVFNILCQQKCSFGFKMTEPIKPPTMNEKSYILDAHRTVLAQQVELHLLFILKLFKLQ